MLIINITNFRIALKNTHSQTHTLQQQQQQQQQLNTIDSLFLSLLLLFHTRALNSCRSIRRKKNCLRKAERHFSTHKILVYYVVAAIVVVVVVLFNFRRLRTERTDDDDDDDDDDENLYFI